MKKIFLVILILILVSVFVEARGILDIARKFVAYSVDVSTAISTEIRPAKANRKNVDIYHNDSYRIYITSGAFSVAVSTTSGYPLDSGKSLPVEFFRNYVGPIYGVAISTPAGSQNIRVIESE